MADPGAQVVGGVEARVHVRKVTVARVADARRGGELRGVVVTRRAGLFERRPETELEAQLRRVAAEQQPFQERRRLRVRPGLVGAEPEVLGVPAGLPRDRLADVRVDLGQGVVARNAAERVGEVGIAARVVERVPGFVHERLVVVEASLRPRDQMDDLRRIGRDHARAR